MMAWRIISWLIFIRLAENINCEDAKWDCTFRIRNDKSLLDFTDLYNKTNDYYIQYEENDKDKNLRVQMCGPLHDRCNGQEGYSACLRIGNKEIGLGRVPVNSYEDGRVMFNFTGDSCQGGNYKLHMMMMCDHGAEKAYPESFPHIKDHCEIFAVWRTHLACAKYATDPAKSDDCLVKGENGNVYDLSSLRLLDSNYNVFIDKSSSIILNVCGPVVFGYRAACPDESGSCLRTVSEGIKYKNIGTVTPLVLEGKNTPVLDYGTGEFCSNGHAKTTISFVCDFKATNTSPVFVGAESDCHYKLNWITSAACSVEDLEEFSRRAAAPCEVRNPMSSTIYNLDSLKGEDRIVKTKNGSEYKFSICGPVNSKFCEAEAGDARGEAGVCAAFNKAIGGLGNSNLLWNITGPYLNYTDGSLCDKNKARSTIIAFACEQEGSNKTSFIDDDDQCNLRIQYYTPLVCKKEDTLCGSGLDVGDNSFCIDPSHQNLNKKYTGVTFAIIIFGVAAGFMTVYLLNAQRRQYLKSCCCAWKFRNPDVRMQYSRINTNEETDALLDAPDTHVQSDSDDDLLRI